MWRTTHLTRKKGDLMLVTIDEYRQLTGDLTTAAAVASAAIDEAIELVEDATRRQLEAKVRTEVVMIWPDRRVYPKAIPIITAPAGVTLDPDGFAMRDVSPDDVSFGGFVTHGAPPQATITYTGGYTTTTLPAALRRIIVQLARAITRDPSPIPAGAVSVRLGDASITYKDSTGASPVDLLVPGSSATLSRYRHPNSW